MILLWVYYSSLILLLGAAFTRCHLSERGKPLVPRNTAVVVRRELLDDGQRKASVPGTAESTTSAVADSDPGPIERDVIER